MAFRTRILGSWLAALLLPFSGAWAGCIDDVVVAIDPGASDDDDAADDDDDDDDDDGADDDDDDDTESIQGSIAFNVPTGVFAGDYTLPNLMSCAEQGDHWTIAAGTYDESTFAAITVYDMPEDTGGAVDVEFSLSIDFETVDSEVHPQTSCTLAVSATLPTRSGTFSCEDIYNDWEEEFMDVVDGTFVCPD